MTVIDHDHDHDHDHHTGHGGRWPGALEPGGRSAGARLAWAISSPWRIALLALAAVLAVDAGGTDEGAGVCVFRRCTGGYCPGCGLTRSARHLLHGEIGPAWRDHPFMVLAAGQVVLAAVVYGAALSLRTRLRSLRTLAIVAAFNGVLLLAVWVLRLVDGSIPRFF